MMQTLFLAMLSILAVRATPLHAEPQRAVVNLKGNRVLVPIDVPSREYFILQRRITVDDGLIVFLYHDPRFRRTVDYAETYSLDGDLLEIGWYTPTEGLKRARDISLDNPKTTGVAGVLRILDELPAQNRRAER
jgi:hypothetical protein